MKTIICMTALVLSPLPATAAESISVKYSWEDARTGEVATDHKTTFVPEAQQGPAWSDPRLPRTLLILDMGKAMVRHLEAWNKGHCRIEPARPVPCPMPGADVIWPPRCPVPVPCGEYQHVAAELEKDIEEFSSRLDAMDDDRDIRETLDLMRRLADNMKTNVPYGPDPRIEADYGGVPGSGAAVRTPGGGGGAGVTTGGAQDFGLVRKLINDGRVPGAGALVMEGYLSTFDLSLSGQACDQLLCVSPAIARDDDSGTMTVQLAMGSSIDAASFRRRPLNLAIVLDISGSMSASDQTGRSRLEWAKDALRKTVAELNEGDLLAIELFDTRAETLLAPTPVTDPDAILALVAPLQTRGSTNLEEGLRRGFRHVAAHHSPERESRVILISDAGLNTGETNPDTILELVERAAAGGTGLTAIGIGQNFKQGFIDKISQSRGGNYIFVHSGSGLYDYFNGFDFLVTPVAYDFKATMELEGIDAKLRAVYGLPGDVDPAKNLLNVQTLFLSHRGGAIILEYER